MADLGTLTLRQAAVLLNLMDAPKTAAQLVPILRRAWPGSAPGLAYLTLQALERRKWVAHTKKLKEWNGARKRGIPTYLQYHVTKAGYAAAMRIKRALAYTLVPEEKGGG